MSRRSMRGNKRRVLHSGLHQPVTDCARSQKSVMPPSGRTGRLSSDYRPPTFKTLFPTRKSLDVRDAHGQKVDPELWMNPETRSRWKSGLGGNLPRFCRQLPWRYVLVQPEEVPGIVLRFHRHHPAPLVAICLADPVLLIATHEIHINPWLHRRS